VVTEETRMYVVTLLVVAVTTTVPTTVPVSMPSVSVLVCMTMFVPLGQNAVCKTTLQSVDAHQDILVTHMLDADLNLDLNAKKIMIVPPDLLALMRNVRIHAVS
jgi:hypothetical protein